MDLLLSLSDLKGEARNLRVTARANGESFGHQEALELVAVQEGYKNWATLKAAAERQPLPTANPFFPDLHRGRVDAQWGPDIDMPCFWTSWMMPSRPQAFFSLVTVRKLVAKFPEKFSLAPWTRGMALVVKQQPGSFEALSGSGSSYRPPAVTVFEGGPLVLYSAGDTEWGHIHPTTSTGAAIMEKAARDYVARYPGAASEFPEYFAQA